MSLAQYIREVAGLTGTKVTILKLPNNSRGKIFCLLILNVNVIM